MYYSLDGDYYYQLSKDNKRIIVMTGYESSLNYHPFKGYATVTN